MTPAETLAAARLSPVGPYVPAREEWLEGWCGPVAPIDGVAAVIVGPDRRPANMRHGPWLCASHDGEWPGGTGLRSCRLDEIRLDLCRREVRHLLVDHGCPSWARACAPAAWAWAGGLLTGLYGPWLGVKWAANVEMRVAMHIDGKRAGPMVAPFDVIGLGAGWCVQPDRDPWPPTEASHGPETGADGRACADLAALRAGCVLEEADGWYVPLPDGGVGWWQGEVAGG